MSHDRRRPAQPQPILEPTERLTLRLSTHAESKPAIKADTGRMAAQLLCSGGYGCDVLVDASEDRTPRRLH
jgi:hypothetical protein